jgi:GntR family transcriptional regulator
VTAPEHAHPRAKGGSAHGAQISVRRVRDLVLAAIRAGDLSADALLDEEELMAMYSASRGAVRGALNQLSELGILERRPRFGTRVVDAGVRLPMTDITMQDLGGVTITVLEQRLVPATPYLREHLSIDTPLLRMVENTFTFNGDIIGLRTAYFSPSVRSDPVSLAGPVSMQELIRGFFGAEPGVVYAWIGAELADTRTSKILSISEGACLLRRELTYLDADDQPIEVVFDAFRADKVSFEKGPVEIL